MTVVGEIKCGLGDVFSVLGVSGADKREPLAVSQMPELAWLVTAYRWLGYQLSAVNY